MKESRQPPCACPIGGVIDLIGKKWTLCIVTTLGNQPRLRFNGLLEALPGVSSRTLSKTLRELRDEGIVARQSFNEVPPRVEYSLTEEGWRLREAILPLMEWAGRHPRAAVVPPGVRGP